MPIGSQVIYNAGDLILSTVSSSGNTFVETKIAAATSSVILFNNSANLTSASLSSLTVGNAISSSYALTASFSLNAGGGSGTVSGSTNYIAKFTSATAIGTSSIYETGSNVGIGTTDPQYKLDVSGSSRHGVISSNVHQFTGSVNINGSLFSNANITASNISASGTGSFGIVGIGTTSPAAKLAVGSSPTYAAGVALIVGTPGNPSTSGTSQPYANLRLGTNTGNSQVLDFGIYDVSPYGSWIQAASGGDLAFPFPLVLNPTGGSLGIGTSNPVATLDIENAVANIPVLNLGGGIGGENVSDLYVLNSYNVNTGVGFAAKVIGVNISGSLTAQNIPVQRTVWSGVTSATAIVLGADGPRNGTQDNAFQIWTTSEGTSGSLLTQKFSLTSTGDVGIGTTAPAYLLDVSGSSRHGYRAADTHQFTGSVSLSDGLSLTNLTASNISASGNIIASKITASNAFINGNLTVTGSIFASLFSASYIYITSSTLVVTDNIITLNALSPYQRYAGIEMYDSGSGNLSSFLWDGQGDYFFVTGSGVNSKIIVGPDQQTNLTSGKLTKATGNNIIGDSIVSDNGSGIIVSGYISGSSVITGNITASNISASSNGIFNNVGVGTSTIRNQLTVIGQSQNTSAISDSGNTGGTIFIGSSLNQVNQGGTLLFSTINDLGTYLPQWGIKTLFTNGTGNGVSDLAFSTRTTGSATSLTEQVRFTSNGRVGIGTNSPATTLNVSGSTRISAGELQLEGDNAAIRLYRTTGINYFDWASGQNFYLGTVTSLGGAGRSNKMVILDGGNVGIGTTVPGSKLQINDSTPTLILRADDGASSRKAYIDFYTTFYNFPSDVAARRTSTISTGFADGTYGTWGTEFMAFHVGSGSANDSALLPIERMRIDGSGNVGVGTSTIIGKLQVNTTSSAYYGPATSSANANGIFILGNTTADVVNTFGADASGTPYAWIQPRKSSAVTYYALALNPNGGNVGIGVTNPSGRLHITASATSGESLIYLSKGSGSISQNFITAVNENNQASYRVTSDINGYTQQTLYRNGTVYVYHDAYWSSYINNANYTQGGLGIGTTSLTHGYGVTIAKPATSGSLYVSGSSVFTGSVSVSGSVTFTGPIIYDNAVLLDFGRTTTPATSTNYVVLQNITGSYNAAFFDYFASSASNFRAGTVIAGWSGSGINYTEYATTDTGNTNQLTMSVDLSSSFIRLLTTVSTTTNWNIKSSGRYL